jgi:hypothetical protein
MLLTGRGAWSVCFRMEPERVKTSSPRILCFIGVSAVKYPSQPVHLGSRLIKMSAKAGSTAETQGSLTTLRGHAGCVRPQEWAEAQAEPRIDSVKVVIQFIFRSNPSYLSGPLLFPEAGDQIPAFFPAGVRALVSSIICSSLRLDIIPPGKSASSNQYLNSC